MIYLDHAATTPLRRESLEAMLPYLTEHYGNPSSPHELGRRARAGLDDARESIARDLNAEPRELVFTSGGSESINLALKGAAWAGKARGNQLIVSAVEHHAVLHAAHHLEKFGFEVTEIPVDRYGRVDPEQLEAAIGERTILVSLIHANNEVGTVQPLPELIHQVRQHRGVLVHVDAVQSAAWLPIDVRALDVDLLSIAAHKFEGPKGVGALYIRRGTVLLPQIQGGTQERYRRAGTENVAGAVGMATAFRHACAERSETAHRARRQRDRLRDALLAVPGVELTGHPKQRLPGHCSVVVRDAEGASIALALDLEGIACSSGAACTTGAEDPSHVLTAMGYPEDESRGALRLTLGRTTTDQETERACTIVPDCIRRQQVAAAALSADPLGLGTGG